MNWYEPADSDGAIGTPTCWVYLTLQRTFPTTSTADDTVGRFSLGTAAPGCPPLGTNNLVGTSYETARGCYSEFWSFNQKLDTAITISDCFQNGPIPPTTLDIVMAMGATGAAAVPLTGYNLPGQPEYSFPSLVSNPHQSYDGSYITFNLVTNAILEGQSGGFGGATHNDIWKFNVSLVPTQVSGKTKQAGKTAYIGAPATCTATVTQPAASATINGDGTTWQYPLTSTTSGCTAIYSAEYDYDGELEGVSRIAPYTFVSNPYHLGNGPHSVTVTYRDVKNNILATSPAVSFSVENNLPQNTCATTCTDISVTSASVAPITIPSAAQTNSAVVSFYGSGAVSVVGGTYCGRVTSSATVNCGTTTAGNLLAVYVRWQSTAGTITAATNNGGTVGYGTQASSAGGFSSEWVYFKNIGGGASTRVTITTSDSSAVLAQMAFQLSGASTTTPLDVNVTGISASSSTCVTTPFTLAQPAADEVILAGATYNNVLVATGTPGWSAILQDTGDDIAVEFINPPATWYGTMSIGITVNGPNSGISKSFYAFVDGAVIGPVVSSSATGHLQFDTTVFSNGSHNVVETVIGGNCPGCVNGIWGSMGQQEQQQTFSNGASPSWLQLSAGEITLCITSQTNCPTSATITGTIVNADGTTTAATITSCVSNNTSFVTVSGTCTVNQVALGTSIITVTSSTGDISTAVVTVLSANTLPHFLTNGTVSTSYIPCPANPCSIWQADQFDSAQGFQPSGTTSSSYAALFGPLYAIGFNTLEDGVASPTAGYANASAWQAALNAQITLDSGYVTSYGLKGIHFVADSYFRDTPSMYGTEYGAYAAWGPSGVAPWQYAIAQLTAAGNVLGIDMVDEVTSSWGGSPLAGVDTGGILIGTSYLSSPLNCVSGTVCTVVTSGVGLNGANRFIITGSGDANLDYNTTSGAPQPYSASAGSGTFTFTTPAGVGTHSYTNGANPGLKLEPYVAWTYDASNNACPPGGGSSGPCPNYIKYDVFKNIRNQTTATTGHVPITWPSVAGATGSVISNWCGKNSVSGIQMADYCTGYWSGNAAYLPTKQSLQSFIYNAMGNGSSGVRSAVYPYMNTQTPLIFETSATMNDYMFHGYPVVVTSCTGNTITTSGPHGVTNVIPDVTRLTVSGSTACNGTYYVISAPTSTTLNVALANGTFFSNQLSTAGTITTQDATIISITGIQANGTQNQDGLINGGCALTRAKLGQTFTATGYGGNFATMAGGWLVPSTVNSCSAYALWRQLPNLSSTGGTANIIPDNYYHQGVSWQTDSDTGPDAMFASAMSALIWNGAGTRNYSYQFDPQLCDYTISASSTGCYPGGALTVLVRQFGGTDFVAGTAVQGAANPSVDVARSIEAFQANAIGNLLAERLVPYAFQPRLPAPDYGRTKGWYEASARTGPSGNLLMIQNYKNSTESCTATLTPYLVPGQSIIRISATWAGIEPIVTLPPGTPSDTMTCNPGEFRAYLFPNTSSVELSKPNLSANLSSVPGASDIQVQYAYTPFVFSAPSVAGQLAIYQTYDCGTGPNCTLPADTKIGTFYYRILYLDSSNNVLKIGPLQAIPN